MKTYSVNDELIDISENLNHLTQGQNPKIEDEIMQQIHNIIAYFETDRLQLLNNLCEFFRRCDRAEMLEIYGERLGDHIWNKFNDLDRNWAWVLCSLDNGNLEKLIKHILK